MNASPDAQAHLLVLADTDERIRRLEHKRSNLPEQQTLDTHVETKQRITEDLHDATRTQERLNQEMIRHEQRIDTANEARRHSESRIYSGQVSNERELAALREQISRAHDTKSDVEDSLIEIMEQLEDVSELVEELAARRSELIEQVAHLTEKRDEAATEIDSELADLVRGRVQEAEQLDGGVLDVYTSLREKRPGRVVARLENRSCTGCRLELTAIELEEIKETSSRSLAYCGQCGSIIIPL